ncbi:unnamed protein product [Darwinula stevensoni]|uniref:Peroxisomal ATPase PEX1 n=1 Tax=Darwinula stevensoni TaxID=69355 RepID=A0A7R9ACF9_9CRUS|nr:unnamed protein product [Darwinula stevensoni]CAG0899824.1 unnamed protein product [Darwinula stevensoni]
MMWIPTQIKFVATTDCFVNFPAAIASPDHRRPLQVICLRTSNGELKYMSGNPVQHPFLEIGWGFAQALGLQEDEVVDVSLWSNCIPCTSVQLVTQSCDDWSLLDIHAREIEETLIHSIRVLFPRMIIPVWIPHSRLPVFVTCHSYEPESDAVMLIEGSCISVSLPLQEQASHGKKSTKRQVKDICRYSVSRKLVLHLVICDEVAESNYHGNTWFVPPHTWEHLFGDDGSTDNQNDIRLYANASRVNIPPEKTTKDHSSVIHLKLGEFPLPFPMHCAMVSKEVAESFSGVAFVSPVNLTPGTSSTLTAFIRSPLEAVEKIENTVRQWMENVLVRNDGSVDILDGTVILLKEGKVRLSTPSPVYSLSPQTLNRLEIKVEVEETIGDSDSEKMKLSYLSVNEAIVGQFVQVILRGLSLCASKGYMMNLLIEGPSGSGRTHLATTICQKLQDHPLNVKSFHLRCKSLIEKKWDSVRRQFSGLKATALLHSPSVIVLDDVDCIASTFVNPEADPQAEVHDRVARCLLDEFSTIPKWRPIALIFICQSVSALHKDIQNIPFIHSVKITNPSYGDRVSLLTALCPEGLDVSEVAQKTESFLPVDLEALVVKARYIAATSGSELTQAHLIVACQEVSTALKNVMTLDEKGITSFDDVGGLRDVKDTLMCKFLWPLQYKDIYKQAPIKLTCNALLYGPPGCGKTLLVLALAKEANVSFISVKGPELLSKYIGASEEAVRNVFERASRARPCILFFDEIDSLAPRRGQESTGVTDRVVNQLLTQIDGIGSQSGQDGMLVLAATNRPDLLDPALLRPGRINHKLFCPFPGLEDRVDILRILCNSVMTDELDLVDIGKECEGFTGADLKALLYNAQLSAFNRILSSQGKVDPESMIVTGSDIQDALLKTKPSLSLDQREWYSLLYEKFQFHKLTAGVSSRLTLA